MYHYHSNEGININITIVTGGPILRNIIVIGIATGKCIEELYSCYHSDVGINTHLAIVTVEIRLCSDSRKLVARRTDLTCTHADINCDFKYHFSSS